MNGLIKSDFKKLFKSKTLFVCVIVAVVLSILSAYMMYNYFKQTENDPAMQMGLQISSDDGNDAISEALDAIPKNNVWSMVNYLFCDGNINILIAICVCVFITSEYTTGTLKNIVSRGFTKKEVYISKFIVSVISSFIITAAYVISGMIVCFVCMPKNTDMSVVQIITCVLTYLFITIALSSMYLMIAMIFRKTGISIVVSIAGSMFISTMFSILAMFVAHFGNYSKYWLPSTLEIVRKSCVNQQIYIPLAVAAAYLIATTVLGMFVFSKRDIK